MSWALNDVKQGSPGAGGEGSKQRHRCKGPAAERAPSFCSKKPKEATVAGPKSEAGVGGDKAREVGRGTEEF